MTLAPIDVARQFLFVREAVSQNNGQRVNAIQCWSGGPSAFGTSWCMWFVTFVLDLCYLGNAPISRQGSCEVVHQLAITNGWMVDVPEVGDVFLRINAAGLAHHTGFITAVHPDGSYGTIAGNTSADGMSSNGDRVAEHPLTPDASTIVFIHLPVSLT